MKLMDNKNMKFYIGALTLALPNIIQQFVTMLSSMVDNVMVGGLNEAAISGVAISNQIFFIFVALMFGIGNSGGIFIAQYKGANNNQKITEVFRMTSLVCLFFGLLVFALLTIAPQIPLSLFAQDADTLENAFVFVRIIKWTYPIFAMCVAIAVSQRYYGIIKISMYASICSVVVNIILNFLLIHGNFGFPALGVRGSAIATLIARSVELAYLVGYVLWKKNAIYTKLFDLFKFDSSLFKDFRQRAYGLVTNEFLWAMGFQLVTVAYTRRMRDNIAAMSIANVIINIMVVGMSGTAVATSIIIGNSLGASKFEQAKLDARRLIRMGGFIGFTLGIVGFLLSFIILMFYNVESSTLEKARWIIIVSSCFSSMYYLNATNFFVIRSGGDTKSVLIMDSMFQWVFVIPLAFLTGLLPLAMPVHFLIVQCSDFVKFALATKMRRKEKWLVNLTNQTEA